jgi:hypothetical protein
MAKKLIRPIRSDADYDAALNEIERYFEKRTQGGHAGSRPLRSPRPDHRRLRAQALAD